MDPASQVDRLHQLFMDLIQVSSLLLPDGTIPGRPISLSQAFALHELDTDMPLTQRDLAERLRLEKSSVSRMAADMERRGLLVRERDPADRRSYRLRLTERGRELHASMAAAFHRHYLRWVEETTPAEREALIVGLSAFLRVMRTAQESGGASAP